MDEHAPRDEERKSLQRLARKHLGWHDRRVQTSTIAALRLALTKKGVPGLPKPTTWEELHGDNNDAEGGGGQEVEEAQQQEQYGNSEADEPPPPLQQQQKQRPPHAPGLRSVVEYLGLVQQEQSKPPLRLLGPPAASHCVANTANHSGQIGSTLAAQLPHVARTLPADIDRLATRWAMQREMLQELQEDPDFDELEAMVFEQTVQKTADRVQELKDVLRRAHKELETFVKRKRDKIQRRAASGAVDDTVLAAWTRGLEQHAEHVRSLAATVAKYEASLS